MNILRTFIKELSKWENYNSNYYFGTNSYSTYNPCFSFCQDIVCKASDGITEFHMGADPWIFKLWRKRIHGLKTGHMPYGGWSILRTLML